MTILYTLPDDKTPAVRVVKLALVRDAYGRPTLVTIDEGGRPAWYLASFLPDGRLGLCSGLSDACGLKTLGGHLVTEIM